MEPVVFSEIMYRPPDMINGMDNVQLEFVELRNITAANAPLYCVFTNEAGYGSAALTHTWRFRNVVDFDFPTNHVLQAGQWLLVAGFDPTNWFAARPTAGLDNSGSLSILAIEHNGSQVSASIASQQDLSYVIEYINNLEDTQWTPLSQPVPGTGGRLVLTDSSAPESRRFYRVRTE